MSRMNFHISDYCLIRHQKIFRKGELLFTGTEQKPVPFFTEAYKHFGINYPKFYKMDSLCKLGLLASEIILQGKEMPCRGEDIGIILYNAASSADTDRVHQRSISDRETYFPSPSIFVYTLPNIVIGEICIRQKIFGESTFFISEKFDPHSLYEYVSQLLEENVMECCLTGWLECDGDYYDGALFMVEKGTTIQNGIVNFDEGKIKEIYSQ